MHLDLSEPRILVRTVCFVPVSKGKADNKKSNRVSEIGRLVEWA